MAPTMDGILQELEREMNNFVATHAAAVAMSITSNTDCPNDDKHVQDTTKGSITFSYSPTIRFSSIASPFAASLMRLQWMCEMISCRCLSGVVRFLLSWLTAAESGSNNVATKIASWLTAQLIEHVLRCAHNHINPVELKTTKSSLSEIENVIEPILDRCMIVFHHCYQLEHQRSQENLSSFFAFKPLLNNTKLPAPESLLHNCLASQWKSVLTKIALHSLQPVRIRIQQELAKTGAKTKLNASANSFPLLLLANLSGLRLGFSTTASLSPANSTPFFQRLKEAAGFLKMLQSFMLKPQKTNIRLEVITLAATILNRELKCLNRQALQVIYTTSQVGEWNVSISELHATALKMCSKKEFTSAAWGLRIAVLCLAPNDIFTRYWKDDMHSLLRLQYHHNKDGSSASGAAMSTLECIGLCFSHLLQRHFIMERHVPNELDCMEIINTTQAWCFFSYPKQKSLQKFMDNILPVLVKISLGISAYNMTYGVQSHIRRLLTESESIFDEKKLVGLESLLAICQHCLNEKSAETTNSSSSLSSELCKKTLLAHRNILGDLVGHILIECNTNFGQELLVDPQGWGTGGILQAGTSSSSALSRNMRDEYRRSLAIQNYATTLRLLEFVYTELEFNEDQKLMLLARAAIHTEPFIRQCANQVLHAIIREKGKFHAGSIIRGFTDYLLRVSCNQSNDNDVQAATILLRLLRSWLQTALHNGGLGSCWKSSKAMEESFLQIEAASVYMLVHENCELRICAVEALEMVHKGRSEIKRHENVNVRDSVLDIVNDLESDIRTKFFSFIPTLEADRIEKQKPGGWLTYMIRDSSSLVSPSRRSFRWSYCLAMLFSRLASSLPEVTVYIWSDVIDKVSKLEPVIPSRDDHDQCDSVDISRWRNLAIFATAAACPNVVQQRASDASDLSSVQDSIQSIIPTSTVVTLLKRLSRYLKSPSMEQKKAAILALGHTNIAAIPLLLDVLAKFDTELFERQQSQQRLGSAREMHVNSPTVSMASTLSLGTNMLTSSHRKIRTQKVKNTREISQFQLQWALGRCYRLLLQNLLRDVQEVHNQSCSNASASKRDTETTIERCVFAIRSYLEQMAIVLDTSNHVVIEVSHIVFMVQQDFCANVQMLLLICNVELQNMQEMDQSDNNNASFSTGQHLNRECITLDGELCEKWFHLLSGWCSLFGSLARQSIKGEMTGTFFSPTSRSQDYWLRRNDVFGERDCELTLAWHWINGPTEQNVTDSSEEGEDAQVGSFLSYFLCQSVFSALAMLLRDSLGFHLFTSWDSLILRWLDECFRVDAASSDFRHFQSLQQLCERAVVGLLQADFPTFGNVIIGRAFFTQSTGTTYMIARNYFHILSAHREVIRKEMTKLDSYAQHGLQIRLCHLILLYLGIENDEQQGSDALTLLQTVLLTSSGNHDVPLVDLALRHRTSCFQRLLPVLSSQLASHTQVTVSTILATRFSALCYELSVSVLRFLSSCEIDQQRKMLVASLPWIAEVSLVSGETRPTENQDLDNNELDQNTIQLLALLFHLTHTIVSTSHEQLEHVWLTLAFSNKLQQYQEKIGLENSSERTTCTNLSKIIEFLLHQRASTVQLATSKTIIWWLCRWENAAFDVILLLLESVTVRRQRAMSDGLLGGRPSITAINPLEDIAVFVTLVSDASRYLPRSDTISSKEMTIRIVHIVLLLLHSLATGQHYSNKTTWPINNMNGITDNLQTKRAKSRLLSWIDSNDGEDPSQSLYVDITRDCLVLLQNLRALASSSLINVIDEVAQLFTQVSSDDICQSEHNHQEYRCNSLQLEKDFDVILKSLYRSCSPQELELWSGECIKEIVFAISSTDIYSDSSGSTPAISSVCSCKTQRITCLRFALNVYNLLAPEFHGDVFLAVLELLHLTLDEQNRDSSNASPLVHDCLVSLAGMMERMPIAKLVLYPQVLWVCMALLNHSTIPNLHEAIMELLLQLLCKPHFTTHQVLQDVILCKRPMQWSKPQSSVLHAVVLNQYAGTNRSFVLAKAIVMQSVLMPCPALMVSASEHAILCTVALCPILLSCMLRQQMYEPENISELRLRTERECMKAAIDLEHLWLKTNYTHSIDLGQLFQGYEGAHLRTGESSAADKIDESEHSSYQIVVAKEFARMFGVAFVSILLEMEEEDPELESMNLCFEILVRTITGICQPVGCYETATMEPETRLTAKEEDILQTEVNFDLITEAALLMMESLLKEIERIGIPWHPTSSLLASLLRLVRIPEQTKQWQAAVRILTYFDGFSPASSSSSLAPIAPALITRPNLDKSVVTVAEMTDGREQPRSPQPSRNVSTPIKKETLGSAKNFLNVMVMRSSSPRHVSNNNNGAQDDLALGINANSVPFSKHGLDPSEDHSTVTKSKQF